MAAHDVVVVRVDTAEAHSEVCELAGAGAVENVTVTWVALAEAKALDAAVAARAVAEAAVVADAVGAELFAR